MTQRPHTTSPTRISFILCEFGISTVRKNALNNRFSVFDNGLNYDALSPDTTDTNGAHA